MSESGSHHDTALEELIAELSQQLIEQLEQGQLPDVEAMAAAHPEYAESIRDTLLALIAMRGIGVATAMPEVDRPEPSNAVRTIGDYQINREIGRGGMGIVYEANQISLDRRVALKILPYAAMLDQRALQRFRNEVTAAAKLNHPNVVDIYGVACDRGVHHYAMRLVDGITMAEVIEQLRIRRDRSQDFPSSISSIQSEAVSEKTNTTSLQEDLEMSLHAHESEYSNLETTKIDKTLSMRTVQQPPEHFRSVAEFGATIAEGLEHAHQQGVVHRDIKPSNLLIDIHGKPWITDFGLAQVETGTALTMTGDLLGTARYMSPEQLMAKRIILDHRTDIYSLGITLYQLLTLQLPFDADNRQELYRQIMLDPPARPRRINPAIPPDLETIVLKCIEKDAADRYQSAQELADDLQRFRHREPIRARKATLGIKSRRWVQRNTAFVSGAMSVASFSLIVMAAIIAFLISERGAKDKALHAEQLATQQATDNFNKAKANLQQAEENFDFAMGILQDFVVSFADSRLVRVPGAERQRQTILRGAAERFNQMVNKKPDRNRLQRAYAEVLYKLGEASIGIDNSLSNSCFEQVITISRDFPLEIDRKPTIQRQMAMAYNGRAKATVDRPEIARHYFEQSLASFSLESDKKDGESPKIGDLATLIYDYGIFLSGQSKDDQAIRKFNEAIDAGDGAIRANSFYELAKIRLGQQDFGQALVLLEQSLSQKPDHHVAKKVHFLKAKVLFQRKEFEKAAVAIRSALNSAERTRGEQMNQPTANLFIELYLLKHQIASRLGTASDSLESLEIALGLHLVYYPRIISEKTMEKRIAILSSLAEAQRASGQQVAAKHREQTVANLQMLRDRIGDPHPGKSFPLGTVKDENLNCVAIDEPGHVYIAGRVSRGTDLQPGFMFQDSDSESPSLICKYDNRGNLLWRCPLDGHAVAMAIDDNSNVFIKGIVNREEKTSIRIGDVDQTLPNDDDKVLAYLAKTDSLGKVQWVRWLPCGLFNKLYFEHSLAVGPDGIVIVGGNLRRDFCLRNDPPLILRTLPDLGELGQGYVAKFSADGDVAWARTVVASQSSVGGVAADRVGNVYMCGLVLDDQPGLLGTDPKGLPFSLAPAQNGYERFGFLAKLDANGNSLWARYQMPEKSISTYDVIVGNDGHVYYSKRLEGPADLDCGNTFEDLRDQVDYPPKRPWESNISCWTTDGELQWHLPLRGSWGYVSAYRLARQANGGVFVTGRAACGGIFTHCRKFMRHPKGGADGFIATVDPQGELQRLLFYTTGTRGWSSTAVPWSIAANRKNQIAVVGRFRGKVRTPTGEILRQPNSETFDGFVTILDND